MMLLIGPREGQHRLTCPVWLCMLAMIPTQLSFVKETSDAENL